MPRRFAQPLRVRPFQHAKGVRVDVRCESFFIQRLSKGPRLRGLYASLWEQRSMRPDAGGTLSLRPEMQLGIGNRCFAFTGFTLGVEGLGAA
jgi:hypothetical protein